MLPGTAALVVAQGAPGPTAIGPVRRRFFPALAGQGQADHVALTCDDGPDPDSTPGFLAALDRTQVRATFFMLGPMARRARPLAAAIAAAGHEVGVQARCPAAGRVCSPRAHRGAVGRARRQRATVVTTGGIQLGHRLTGHG